MISVQPARTLKMVLAFMLGIRLVDGVSDASFCVLHAPVGLHRLAGGKQGHQTFECDGEVPPCVGEVDVKVPTLRMSAEAPAVVVAAAEKDVDYVFPVALDEVEQDESRLGVLRAGGSALSSCSLSCFSFCVPVASIHLKCWPGDMSAGECQDS